MLGDELVKRLQPLKPGVLPLRGAGRQDEHTHPEGRVQRRRFRAVQGNNCGSRLLCGGLRGVAAGHCISPGDVRQINPGGQLQAGVFSGGERIQIFGIRPGDCGGSRQGECHIPAKMLLQER